MLALVNNPLATIFLCGLSAAPHLATGYADSMCPDGLFEHPSQRGLFEVHLRQRRLLAEQERHEIGSARAAFDALSSG